MQATRAFRWAGDKLAIGAGGSFGASTNKGAGEINSFNGAGPATLFLSIVTPPLFSNWSGDDREIDNTPCSAPSSQTPFACYVFPKRSAAICQDQPAISIDESPKSRPSSRLRACIFVLTRFRYASVYQSDSALAVAWRTQFIVMRRSR